MDEKREQQGGRQISENGAKGKPMIRIEDQAPINMDNIISFEKGYYDDKYTIRFEMPVGPPITWKFYVKKNRNEVYDYLLNRYCEDISSLTYNRVL